MRTNTLSKSFSFSLGRSSEIGYSLSPRSHPGLRVSAVTVKKTASLLRTLWYIDRFGPKTRHNLRPLRSLHNTRGDKKALIIAGGPSASLLSPQVVSSAQADGSLEVFAMNRFCHSFLGAQVAPDWVVQSDPHELTELIVSSLDAYPSAKLLVPLDVDLGSSFSQRDAQRVFRFEDRSIEGWGRGINPTKLRRYIALTALKAMALAFFCGYKEIGLIGFDNTMHKAMEVDGTNRLLLNNNHHKGAGGPEDRRPIHRRQEGGKTKGSAKNLADYFYNEATTHLHLDTFFKPTGRFVNLSPESDLVSFERKDLNTFLR